MKGQKKKEKKKIERREKGKKNEPINFVQMRNPPMRVSDFPKKKKIFFFFSY